MKFKYKLFPDPRIVIPRNCVLRNQNWMDLKEEGGYSWKYAWFQIYQDVCQFV